jgi:hypothetical protein
MDTEVHGLALKQVRGRGPKGPPPQLWRRGFSPACANGGSKPNDLWIFDLRVIRENPCNQYRQLATSAPVGALFRIRSTIFGANIWWYRRRDSAFGLV